ncbi:MAG: hypothetical protein QOF48_495 [Verrucomicrobiota bacterium]|jgi:WD40 repeat protein
MMQEADTDGDPQSLSFKVGLGFAFLQINYTPSSCSMIQSSQLMKIIQTLLRLVVLALGFGFTTSRADEIAVPVKPPSVIGTTPDAGATALMPYPIYSFSIESMAFSPDGRTLATGDGNGNLRLWNVAKGELQSTVRDQNGWIFSIAWFADGRHFVTAGKDRLIRTHEALHPERVVTTLAGHSNDVHSIAITANGTTLVSAGDDRTVRIWDVANSQLLRTLTGHEKQIPSIALSPDGARIASGSRDGTVRLWDAATGNEAGILRGHTGDVMSVKFSPDGKFLASGGYDQTIRLWDARTGMPGMVFTGHTYRVYSVAFAPGGKRLASAGDQTARIWDVTTGQNMRTFKLQGEATTSPAPVRMAVSVVAFSPDGQTLAFASTFGTVHLISTATGAILRTLTPPEPSP